MESHIKVGKYKHYKGGEITVIGVARHSENYDQELVIYSHPHQGHEQLWARPIAMFLEDVEFDGRTMPRFEYIGA